MKIITFEIPPLIIPTPDIVLRKHGKKIVREEVNQKELVADINKYKPKKR